MTETIPSPPPLPPEPPLVEVETSARVMTFNIRLAGYPVDIGSRAWTARRRYVVQAIKEATPSVIGVQECNTAWQPWLEVALGNDQWAQVGLSTARIFYDVTKWQLLNAWPFHLPSGLRKRFFIAAHLRSIKTGGTFLACNTHLASGGITEPNPAKIRAEQMHYIGRDILPTLPDHDKAVITADLNSAPQNAEVRAIARIYGLQGLRRRLTPDPASAKWKSFNGWKVTQTGEQIDDILVAKDIDVRGANLNVVCTRRFPIVASDHNLWISSLRFNTLVPAPLP